MAKSLPISASASWAISGERSYTSTNFLRAPGPAPGAGDAGGDHHAVVAEWGKGNLKNPQ